MAILVLVVSEGDGKVMRENQTGKLACRRRDWDFFRGGKVVGEELLGSPPSAWELGKPESSQESSLLGLQWHQIRGGSGGEAMK